MKDVDPMASRKTDREERRENEFQVEAYRQNFETFRSLNTLFWQIPLIAMTLTGGLWFGVSAVESEPSFRRILLALAGLGNFGLIFVLHRLRYIMDCYLQWLETAYPAGHVAAKGEGKLTRGRLVQVVFSVLMAAACAFSFILLLLL